MLAANIKIVEPQYEMLVLKVHRKPEVCDRLTANIKIVEPPYEMLVLGAHWITFLGIVITKTN